MKKTKEALLVYGGWEGHDPCGVADVFAEILENENFAVTKSDTLDVFLSDLAKYDLIIPVWTMGSLTSAQEKSVCAAIAAGTGIAGCHGGMCDAFRNNTTWQFMTGAQWVAHPGNGDVTYEVNINKASSSALIEGIEDFISSGCAAKYANGEIPEGELPLCEMSSKKDWEVIIRYHPDKK